MPEKVYLTYQEEYSAYPRKEQLSEVISKTMPY